MFPYLYTGLFLAACATPLSTYAQVGSAWEHIEDGHADGKKYITKRKQALKQWSANLIRYSSDSVFRHKFGLLGRINTNGWMGGVFWRWQPNYHLSSTTMQLTFSEIKHEKEVKQKRENTSFLGLANATDYIYGKSSYLYTLNVGLSREKIILPNLLDGTASLGLRGDVGFSLAMSKPYYLRLIRADTLSGHSKWIESIEKYSVINRDLFLDNRYILGSGRSSRGWRENTYALGLYAGVSTTLEIKNNSRFSSIVAVGSSINLYMEQLNIMIDNTAKFYNISMHITLELGLKY